MIVLVIVAGDLCGRIYKIKEVITFVKKKKVHSTSEF